MPPRPPTSPSPPPAPFPFTIGSFDFPHASTSDRHPPRRPSRRGPMHRLFGPPRDSEPIDHLSRRPSTANPNRPRATPSERYLRRSQARIRDHRASLESAADSFDTLSDIPLSNPYTNNVRPPSSGADTRQSKRRKLDHKSGTSCAYDGYKYGYKGQVVAGRLKMQVVSCDGGEYYERDNPALYTVHNVLKNDKSVYCSESSRCNLLLRHIGSAPFTLEKIVIRAPDRGFTAPVQEGLIFVSMTENDLLDSTSAYDLHYGSTPRPASPIRSNAEDDEELSLQEALDDPYIWQHSRRAPEHTQEEIDSLRTRMTRLNRESSLRSEYDRRRTRRHVIDHDEDDYSEHCDRVGEDSYPMARRISAPTPPPFTVTTASEEEASDSNEDVPSPAVMADRLRRESRWRAENDDTGDSPPRFGGLRRAQRIDFSAYNNYQERRTQNEPLRASQIAAPSSYVPSSNLQDEDEVAAPSRFLPSSNLQDDDHHPHRIPYHARFFIAKNKSKITIRFPNAISGRAVLLKLWSPTHDGNIDIESVQFYGYSGPRYFPAMQPC